MYLIEDERLDGAERVARLRGEHEIERLRCRDQDVRRLPKQLASLLLRRVARTDGDPDLRVEPCKRAAKVPLDVVVERLERRDVEHAKPGARSGSQPVERVEERRQRLARTGRRLDQDMLAGCDRRPPEYLRRRWRVERLPKPGPRRGRKGGERIHQI